MLETAPNPALASDTTGKNMRQALIRWLRDETVLPPESEGGAMPVVRLLQNSTLDPRYYRDRLNGLRTNPP